jgi:hypothetical protein
MRKMPCFCDKSVCHTPMTKSVGQNEKSLENRDSYVRQTE